MPKIHLDLDLDVDLSRNVTSLIVTGYYEKTYIINNANWNFHCHGPRKYLMSVSASQSGSLHVGFNTKSKREVNTKRYHNPEEAVNLS